MAPTPKAKPRMSEVCTIDTVLDGKSSLVKGELADLEAMRQEGRRSSDAAWMNTTTQCWEDFLYNLKIVRRHPGVLAIPLLVFAILCGGGLCLLIFLALNQNAQEKDEAQDLAVETGRWFCKSSSSATSKFHSYFYSRLTTARCCLSTIDSRTVGSCHFAPLFLGTVCRRNKQL